MNSAEHPTPSRSAARGGVGNAEQQSPTEDAAHPDSVIIQTTAPSEGEPPAQRESKQEALTAELRMQAQTKS
jgi:hypothetical protein